MIRSTFLTLIFFLLASLNSNAQYSGLLNLNYEDNYTPAYYEVIDMYKKLDAHYENAALVEMGNTDSGKPLHLFIINNGLEFNPALVKAQGKAVLLINNGIHAGEPAGIDASLQFADDILRNKDGMASILNNTVVIPEFQFYLSK